jgi:hypothetical protein
MDSVMGLIVLCVLVGGLGGWIWRIRQVKRAQSWPSAEATIQSGDIEVVHGEMSYLFASPALLLRMLRVERFSLAVLH